MAEAEAGDGERAAIPIEALKSPTFLERRIEHLLELLREEKLVLDYNANVELRNELARDLYNLQRHPNGRINLATCTPLVRSTARSLYALKDVMHEEAEPAADPEPQTLDDYVAAEVPSNPFDAQRELFAIYSEFFQRFTGKNATSFADVSTFFEEFKKTDPSRYKPDAVDWLREAGSEFYRFHFQTLPKVARNQGGFKLIVGGSERFTASTVNAVRSMLLYSDTILIPDPGPSWLAVDRREEQFPITWLLAAAFFLLALKPLVDADLPYPAVLVVPTFDRRLVLESEETRDQISRFKLEFFSNHLGRYFEDESEIYHFARSSESEFLKAVDSKRLFYAPEGDGTETICEALRLYKGFVSRYRSRPYKDVFSRWSDGEIVVNGIEERIEPQYHLRDNAEWLNANPMMWHDAQWHYFKLCAEVSEKRLKEEEVVSAQTLSTIRALNTPGLQWLGNVPIQSLVELRRRNENETFRKKMREFIGALHESALVDIDRVAAEVSRGITSLVVEHQNELRKIEDKYRPQYVGTAGASWVTVAAQFLPWLFPSLPEIPDVLGKVAAPIALASSYAKVKIHESFEKKRASQTLTGVLSAARTADGKQRLP